MVGDRTDTLARITDLLVGGGGNPLAAGLVGEVLEPVVDVVEVLLKLFFLEGDRRCVDHATVGREGTNFRHGDGLGLDAVVNAEFCLEFFGEIEGLGKDTRVFGAVIEGHQNFFYA